MLSTAIFATNPVFAMIEDDIEKEALKTATKQKNQGQIFGCPRAIPAIHFYLGGLIDTNNQAISPGVPVNISDQRLSAIEVRAYWGDPSAQKTLRDLRFSEAKATQDKN